MSKALEFLKSFLQPHIPAWKKDLPADELLLGVRDRIELRAWKRRTAPRMQSLRNRLANEQSSDYAATLQEELDAIEKTRPTWLA